jgi:hypothetical protein
MLCALVDPGFDVPPELAGVLDQLSEGLLTGSGLVDCDTAAGPQGPPPEATPGEGTPVPGVPEVPGLQDLAQPYYAGAAAPDTSRPAGLDAVVAGALPAPAAGEGADR